MPERERAAAGETAVAATSTGTSLSGLLHPVATRGDFVGSSAISASVRNFHIQGLGFLAVR
ncbi:hypothetical protein ACFXD5_23670 [Streptomyces sp. NPDC059385]|uniref:hypothetical protein n=1 Tax=Streptomyces sp. NPDC059385 TaxID=3346817 RepID=UPI00368563C7